MAIVSKRGIEHLYAVWKNLEGLAGRLCAGRASASGLRGPALLEEDFERAAKDADLNNTHGPNGELHDEIAMAGRNGTLVL